MTQQPEVRENTADQRFEIWLDGEQAGLTDYQSAGQSLAFVHTQIGQRFAGRGLGSVLIRSALDAVRERGLTVLPYCSFVTAFIQKHPEYLDLVPGPKRGDFGLPETDDPAATES